MDLSNLTASELSSQILDGTIGIINTYELLIKCKRVDVIEILLKNNYTVGLDMALILSVADDDLDSLMILYDKSYDSSKLVENAMHYCSFKCVNYLLEFTECRNIYFPAIGCVRYYDYWHLFPFEKRYDWFRTSLSWTHKTGIREIQYDNIMNIVKNNVTNSERTDSSFRSVPIIHCANDDIGDGIGVTKSVLAKINEKSGYLWALKFVYGMSLDMEKWETEILFGKIPSLSIEELEYDGVDLGIGTHMERRIELLESRKKCFDQFFELIPFELITRIFTFDEIWENLAKPTVRLVSPDELLQKWLDNLDFTKDEMEQLSIFATSCVSPNPIVFKFDNSPLDNFPTASTCVNIVSVPRYKNFHTFKAMVKKIITVTGFGLV